MLSKKFTFVYYTVNDHVFELRWVYYTIISRFLIKQNRRHMPFVHVHIFTHFQHTYKHMIWRGLGHEFPPSWLLLPYCTQYLPSFVWSCFSFFGHGSAHTYAQLDPGYLVVNLIAPLACTLFISLSTTSLCGL